MNMTRLPANCALLLGAAALALSQPAAAVVANIPGSHGATAYGSADSSGPIERGGTITGINVAGKTITVDGTVYFFPMGSVAIHGAPASSASPRSQLQKGAAIKFNTVPSYRRQRVTEVWVVTTAKPAQRK
jgi:hypothetical protein